jgi:membrane fusion protein (multidrug efflux system)
MRTFLTATLAALALLGCKPRASSNDPAPPPPPAPGLQAVKGTWVEAQRKDLRRFATAAGTFKPRQSTRVGSQVSGRVKDVLVDVGATVRKGQDLVRLDPVMFEIEISQRKADLDAAKVALADAEINLKRMKALWEKPAGETPSIPRKLFDDAVSRNDAAAARIKQAETALKYAEERLRETTIKSPFDGVVSRRFVDDGEPVTSMPITALVEVQDASVLELEFSLPQELLRSVRAGTPVDFEADGVEGNRRPGKIDVVYPALDEATRSFRCRVLAENPGLKYRPGLLARVRVVVEEAKDALTVPRAAATSTGDAWRVLGNGGDGPAPRPVKVGLVTGEDVQILEGLKAGDRVLLPER